MAEYPSGGNRSEGDISRFVPEYWHQDHPDPSGTGQVIGNTRLAFADFNEDSFIEIKDNPGTPENELEITQEAHYYPFGMGHLGPWYATVAPENRYLYNGKELNEDYGINLMDYGARWYDPALGRFTGVDPLAEVYSFQSPFAYAANNPISNIDIFGMAPASIEGLIVSVWAQGTGTYDNTGRRTDNNEEKSTEEDCCPGLGIGGAQARSQNAQAIAETTGERYESSYLELSESESRAGLDGSKTIIHYNGKWVDNTDESYPYQEAVWGYHELVFDDSHYEKLVEGEEEAERIYFRRKIELEKKLAAE